MDRIAVIMLAGERQNICFWPSYYNCKAGISHDLIIVHRDGLGLPEEILDQGYGEIKFLNKIVDGVDIPHRAFGAYRYSFNLYKNNYDYFIFISDDVVLKRDSWLLDIINVLNKHEKLGFGASQIFHGGKGFPEESHIRAPFWFAKTEALNKTVWEFDHDHTGEMRIGDQITQAGYFGVQVGNKLTLGFDSTEKDHITQLLEKKYFPQKSEMGKYDLHQYDYFLNNIDEIKSDYIVSPYNHIGKQNVLIDIEPFDGLIYNPSLEIAKKCVDIIDIGHNTYIIKN